MEITVNNQAIEVQVNCFEQKYGDLFPAISITATAPNGSNQECYWEYIETWDGSGVFKFCDEAFNSENESHIDFCSWLQKQTGCDEDEAVEATEEIFGKIDISDKYTEDKEELVELYVQDTTEAVLEAGTMVSDVSASIYESNDGRYIGVIFKRCNLQIIAELSKAEYKAARKEAVENQYGNYSRWKAIHGAIEKAAGIEVL